MRKLAIAAVLALTPIAASAAMAPMAVLHSHAPVHHIVHKNVAHKTTSVAKKALPIASKPATK